MTTVKHTASIELSQVDCRGCGGVYAISKPFLDRKREVGGFWHYPYCKSDWGYRKDDTDLEKARRELALERARHDQTRAERDRQRDRRAAEERRVSAYKGQLTRVKNRVGRGVCPCCNRSFANLERHMRCKHPDYAVKDVGA